MRAGAHQALAGRQRTQTKHLKNHILFMNGEDFAGCLHGFAVTGFKYGIDQPVSDEVVKIRLGIDFHLLIGQLRDVMGFNVQVIGIENLV